MSKSQAGGLWGGGGGQSASGGPQARAGYREGRHAQRTFE